MTAVAQTETPPVVGTHRRLTLAVVALPALGTIAALVLAIRQGGLAPFAIWIFLTSYLLSAAGVEIGFHRYFSHRSFKCSPAVRWVMGILGSIAAQGPVFFWVAMHRRHHRFTDTDNDPHAPLPRGLRGFWRAHIGWLFEPPPPNMARAIPDLVQDRATLYINRFYFVWLLLGLLVPAVIGLAIGGWYGALLGFLWGGPVRIFVNHNVTWSINSLCHLLGARPHETHDDSGNVWFLALPSLGGSWHNNHHAFPTSALNDLTWWQFDPGAWIIRGAAAAGLVWDVRKYSEKFRQRKDPT